MTSVPVIPHQTQSIADVKPIRSDADLRWALGETERYFEENPEIGSPDGDRFEILLALVAAYEAEHDPVGLGDPIDMLLFAIEDLGRSRTDLADLVGSPEQASEILDRRSHLTLPQVQAISQAWHLPIEVLAAPYKLARDAA